MEYDRTLYELLEISENASNDVIKMAYKALALRYHPDLNMETSEKSEQMIKAINNAKEILLDKNARTLYDEELKVHRMRSNNTKEKHHSKPATTYFKSVVFTLILNKKAEYEQIQKRKKTRRERMRQYEKRQSDNNVCSKALVSLWHVTLGISFMLYLFFIFYTWLYQ